MFERALERWCVGDRARRDVVDHAALIGDEGPVVLPFAQSGLAECCESRRRRGVAEAHHLDGHAPRGAESGDQLAFVDEQHRLACGGHHDLLTREHPATALDHVESRVDLVGPVDTEIDVPGAVVAEQWNAERTRQGLALARGGHAHERTTSLDQRRERLDEELGGRAAAEPDDAPVGQQRERGPGRFLLEAMAVVVRRHGISSAASGPRRAGG